MFECYNPLNPNHMKKIYSFIFTSAITLFSLNASSATIVVMVGQNSSGAAANEYNPATFTASVGDVVAFTWFSGIHNVTNASVPGGATPFSSGTMSSTGVYNYNVTVAGTHAYFCSFHSTTMGGGFSATPTGIATPTVDLLTSAYPNPFKDKFTLKYGAVESIDLFNVIGEKVKSFDLPKNETKTEIDLSDLNTGVYFIRTYKEGVIVETKKIVKTK